MMRCITLLRTFPFVVQGPSAHVGFELLNHKLCVNDVDHTHRIHFVLQKISPKVRKKNIASRIPLQLALTTSRWKRWSFRSLAMFSPCLPFQVLRRASDVSIKTPASFSARSCRGNKPFSEFVPRVIKGGMNFFIATISDPCLKGMTKTSYRF